MGPKLKAKFILHLMQSASGQRRGVRLFGEACASGLQSLGFDGLELGLLTRWARVRCFGPRFEHFGLGPKVSDFLNSL